MKEHDKAIDYYEKAWVINNKNYEEKTEYISIRSIFLEQLHSVRNNMKKQWNTIKTPSAGKNLW
jgi:hypothetical protein